MLILIVFFYVLAKAKVKLNLKNWVMVKVQYSGYVCANYTWVIKTERLLIVAE